jgi:tryptophan 2-monooxygenase
MTAAAMRAGGAAPAAGGPAFSMFGPDFPFAYDDWLGNPAGLGRLPPDRLGAPVAIVGAGMAGLTAAYELMRLGARPVIYESAEIGGRLRSRPFEGADGVVAELGGMRFPVSARAFWAYADLLGLDSRPFPNPLTEAAGSTVIDLEGETVYAERPEDLPPMFREVAAAYDAALADCAGLPALDAAIAARDWPAVKAAWDPLVPLWDERSFYDFVTSAPSFRRLSFRHREVFGQVGFGTGGWDSDFPNSMLEILRVAAARQDEDQRLIVGGVEQVPQGLWRRPAPGAAHWPAGTSLRALHGGATRPGAARIARAEDGALVVTDRWGRADRFEAVLCTCQSWLLTTAIDVEERLFPQKLWMALDRTRYMQSAKTFVMVDRPFWRERDPATGRRRLSMTLTDRLIRGCYLFDDGPDRPGVICLSYAWMSDALKVLPLPVERRVDLALGALEKIYPGLDIRARIVGDPITVSWEADPNFLGAFKGALPGHYRYTRRMFAHFMQEGLAPDQRGLFLAGDDASFTPGWVEGAVQTALNAVAGVVRHLGGASAPGNPGPCEAWVDRAPLTLPD